jgi:ParB family chromosome partitioning protein
MTTAVHQKPPAPSKAAAAAPSKIIFQGKVNLDLIDVREQVRKKFDENAHKELTASIQKMGDVINPITLRPKASKAGRYELVAGERRFRGAKAAGLASDPGHLSGSSTTSLRRSTRSRRTSTART